MPLNDQEHLEHIKNVLKQRLRVTEQEKMDTDKRYHQLILQFKEQIQAIDNIQSNWQSLGDAKAALSLPLLPIKESGKREGTIPVTDLIHRYVKETGKQLFNAADIKKYAESLGYETNANTYNSIYGTLQRWEKASPPRLIRRESKFVLACEHGLEKEQCEKCQQLKDREPSPLPPYENCQQG
jgi:hypothetical protein